ncbi:zinc finger MYM-type protein 5-like [Aphis gossypii]|uniref:zinc finger MYM-type protein 5-like n=1 Tax=Aphis gossypii TaxID=80765 RepID=UPI0021591555|nr:zinc finger MYM-type protein 5-like [Aphis gossypii]
MYFKANVKIPQENVDSLLKTDDIKCDVAKLLLNATVVHAEDLENHINENEYQNQTNDVNNSISIDEITENESNSLINNYTIKNVNSTSITINDGHIPQSNVSNLKDMDKNNSDDGDVSEKLLATSEVNADLPLINNQEINLLTRYENIENSDNGSEFLENISIINNFDDSVSTILNEYQFDTHSHELESLSNSFKWKNDPTIFLKIARLTPEMINMILKLGPCQPKAKDLPNSQFPKVGNRCFHEAWYYRKLPDGTMMHRDWLTYSPDINRVFCLHCMLFGKKSKKAWVSDGFCKFQNGSISLMSHETTDAHVEASLKVKMRELTLPLIPSIVEEQKKQVAFNREIVGQ